MATKQTKVEKKGKIVYVVVRVGGVMVYNNLTECCEKEGVSRTGMFNKLKSGLGVVFMTGGRVLYVVEMLRPRERGGGTGHFHGGVRSAGSSGGQMYDSSEYCDPGYDE